MSKNIKGRNWAFVVYPESLPDNWREIVTDTGLPMAFSPLHNKDVDPNGEIKKAHYHVICYYENATTFNSVKENVCDKLNATIPIKLEALRGMYRYHLHLDNPDKYQYKDSERQFFNGFDVHKVGEYTYTEISQMLRNLQNIIKKYKIVEYSDLLDFLLDNELFELWDVARNHTILLNTYISSRRYKTTQEKNQEDKKNKKDLQ